MLSEPRRDLSGTEVLPSQLHEASVSAIHKGVQIVENTISGAYQGTKGAVSSGWNRLKHKAGY